VLPDPVCPCVADVAAEPQGAAQAGSQGAASPAEAAAASELAEHLQGAVKVAEPAVDEPDLSLRLKEELRERPEAEITTQVSAYS
jgi:hypothetical protein